MNTYIALWDGKRATVQCDTGYGAQQLAARSPSWSWAGNRTSNRQTSKGEA